VRSCISGIVRVVTSHRHNTRFNR